jgi:lipopolysaccharide biosynthesis glycosyltransferase
MPILHLASAISRQYLLPLAVLLDAIRRHHPADLQIAFHLLHTDLQADDLVRLSTVGEIHPIQIPPAFIQRLPADRRFPIEASVPLLLAEVLPPEVERVLFLDADTWVCDDLRPLWAVGLGDQVLAAVADPAIPLVGAPRGVKGCRDAGIPEGAPYFNAGVMLIQLEQWRRRAVSRLVDDYLRRHAGRVDFLHQEALNAVLWNRWQPLDERWNVPGSLAGRLYGKHSDAWRTPGIVHFAGTMKPWQFAVGGRYSQSYRAAMAEVVSLFPPPAVSAAGLLKSQYDRRCREMFYPIERYLWRNRWF